MKKVVISRDDVIYEAFPDVALTPSGKLVCVVAECTHHRDRSYTRIGACDSTDRGRSWSHKRSVSAPANGLPYYNCPRISALRDGRLAVIVDTIGSWKERQLEGCINWLYISSDEGATWGEPVATPALGIVPDKLIEMNTGRWLISCHSDDPKVGALVQRLWISDDHGKSWSQPIVVGRQEGLDLCEGSIFPVGEQMLVCFMRENSGLGRGRVSCLSTLTVHPKLMSATRAGCSLIMARSISSTILWTMPREIRSGDMP